MQPEMCVIVPSRERPGNIARLIQAWTETEATSALHVVVDRDDPTLDEVSIIVSDEEEDPFDPNPDIQVITEPGYRPIVANTPDNIWMSEGKRTRLGPTLNREAVKAAKEYAYVGFMGDDHLPRTIGWDQQLLSVLRTLKTGIAYGDDLMQGANLPTAVFMSSDIINTLGYMVPIGLTHLFLDNTWKLWGERLGKLSYCPTVVIEHMHPQAGKAKWDENYTRVNSTVMWEHDETVFEEYKENGLESDIEKLRGLL